jgi:hypothetical protein
MRPAVVSTTAAALSSLVDSMASTRMPEILDDLRSMRPARRGPML